MATEDQNPRSVGTDETQVDAASADAAARARLKNAVVAGLLVLLILACVVFIVFRSQTASPKSEPPPAVAKLATPELPLDRGTSLVLVLAFDCDHCKQVGRLVSTFDTEKLGIQIYIMGYGTDDEAQVFLAETGLVAPYRSVTNEEYLAYSGSDSTTAYLLRDGLNVSVWLGYDFSLAKLKSVLYAQP